MTKVSEKKIQNAAIKYANGLGIRVIRLYFGPGMTTGWPDVLFLIPSGRPLFIEFKAPGKSPTKLQAKKIQYLEEDGYSVIWVDNLAAAKRGIDEALKWKGKDVRISNF